jgi:hypothetical protein
MKKSKNESAGSAKKNSPKQEEVSGRLSKDGGLQPLGAQKRAPHRLTTVPREGTTNTTVPRE